MLYQDLNFTKVLPNGTQFSHRRSVLAGYKWGRTALALGLNKLALKQLLTHSSFLLKLLVQNCQAFAAAEGK